MLAWLVFSFFLTNPSSYAAAVGCEDHLDADVGFSLREFQLAKTHGKTAAVDIAGLSFPLIREHVQGEEPDESNFRYRVPIGRISNREFKKIKEAFPEERDVRYEDDRFYLLEDFLRPFVGATEGHVFESYVSHDIDIERALRHYAHKLKRGMSLSPLSYHVFWSTNCWQTVIEFLRNSSTEIGVYYPDIDAATRFFSDRAYFHSLPEERLHYGDVLLISHNEKSNSKPPRAIHAAIFIADGLFYEKSASNSRALYRFLLKKDLERAYPPKTYGWTYLRPTGRPMPPMEFFSLAAQKTKLASLLNLPGMERISLEGFGSKKEIVLAISGMRTIPYPK